MSEPNRNRPPVWEAESKSAGWPTSDSTAECDTPNGSGPSLLDELDLARARRDDGVRRAELNTWSGWREAADAWVARKAAERVPFTSDDLHADLGPPTASGPQAVGPVFLAAARAGIIRKVGYRTSVRASRQSGVVAIWVGDVE